MISVSAFYYQENLVNVSFPTSLQAISPDAFNNCKITSLTFPVGSELVNIDASAFFNCNITTLNWGVNGGIFPVSFGVNAFGTAGTLKTLNILEGVTEIADGQFSATAYPWTAELTTLSLPASLVTIGALAFNNCTGIEEITFPVGSVLKTIANGAFYGCRDIAGAIEFPASLVTIGYGAFYNCTGIEEITFPVGSVLATIDNIAFYGCTDIAGAIEFPASLQSIGDQAFNNCYNITSLTFPAGSSLASIGNSVFMGCSLLDKVEFKATTLPASIGTSTFDASFPNGSTEYYVQNQAMKDVLMSAPLHNIPAIRIHLPPGLKDGNITFKTPSNTTITTQPDAGVETNTVGMLSGTYTVTYSIYDSKGNLLYTETNTFTLPLSGGDYLDMEFLEDKKFAGNGFVMEKVVITGPNDYKKTWINKFNIKPGTGPGDIDPLYRGITAKEK